MPKQGNLFPEVLPVEEVADSCPSTSNPVNSKPIATKPAASEKKERNPGLKRRKKAKRNVEDYYALLGVGEDATAADIKRGYLQKTRQFPPESHPLEFERIRIAYDTLRDDTLRKEYDIVRQFGESVHDLLQEALGKRGITAQSVKVLERAVAIDPLHTKARLALAYAYIYRGNTLSFEEQFHELQRQAGPGRQLVILQNKIEQLMQVHRVQDAFDELQEIKKTHPDAIKKIWPVFVDVYSAALEKGQLLAEVETAIKAGAVPEASDAELYAAWIYIVTAFDKGEKQTDRVLSATRKWLKNFNNAADLVCISQVFFKEYEKCRVLTDFYGAKNFIDLAVMADRKNTVWRQYAQEMETVVQIMREVNLMFEDTRLFPGVFIEVLRCINEEFNILQEDLEEVLNVLPEEFQEALPDMGEEYAVGILWLKKRYPVIYRHYQQRWEAMFKEKTVGLYPSRLDSNK